MAVPLVTRGAIRPGETVLALSAAGGLRCTAVQIAADARCRGIAVGDSHTCLAHCGRILAVRFAECTNAALEQVAMNRVLLKQATVIGYPFGEPLRRGPAENTEIWHALEALIASNKITPIVYGKPYHGLESITGALSSEGCRG